RASQRAPLLGALACGLALLLGPGARGAHAEEFDRPGFYLGGSAFWLDEELEDALELENVDLSVGDSRGASATLGARLGSRLSLELVGERYDDLDIDLDVGGLTASGDLEVWSAMLQGKLY